MEPKIIVDSCCDLTPALRNVLRLEVASLKITSNGKEFVDDENIDVKDLLANMKASRGPVATACPAPDDYARLMEKADESFVVTLSSKLSGSYNSASVARDMVLEAHPEKKIYIIDSESAAAGELRIALLLREMVDSGMPFDDIQTKIRAFTDKLCTLFVLETLDNLVKNGRITKMAGMIGTMLNLRPLMGENGHGEIIALEKIRGTQNALRRLVDMVAEKTAQCTQNSITLVMSYCNCPERANELKKDFLATCSALKEVIMVPTGGLSTAYASDGGVIVAF
ncbi:MAG: DegV family protein [Oscillospiraceae bacterium]